MKDNKERTDRQKGKETDSQIYLLKTDWKNQIDGQIRKIE